MKFFPALLLVFLVACKKNSDELPAATQSGANTFGCRIDGNAWIPQRNAIFPGAPILEARQMPNNDLYINARNFSSSPTETEFEIFIKNMNTPDTYTFNTTLTGPNPNYSYIYYVKRNVTPLNEWMTSASYAGTVTITTYNTTERFVSGTFQLQAINLYNAPLPINVTEGRFDVKIQ